MPDDDVVSVRCAYCTDPVHPNDAHFSLAYGSSIAAPMWRFFHGRTCLDGWLVQSGDAPTAKVIAEHVYPSGDVRIAGMLGATRPVTPGLVTPPPPVPFPGLSSPASPGMSPPFAPTTTYTSSTTSGAVPSTRRFSVEPPSTPTDDVDISYDEPPRLKRLASGVRVERVVTADEARAMAEADLERITRIRRKAR
jgi:hypothetical protein